MSLQAGSRYARVTHMSCLQPEARHSFSKSGVVEPSKCTTSGRACFLEQPASTDKSYEHGRTKQQTLQPRLRTRVRTLALRLCITAQQLCRPMRVRSYKKGAFCLPKRTGGGLTRPKHLLEDDQDQRRRSRRVAARTTLADDAPSALQSRYEARFFLWPCGQTSLMR